jgi:alkylation response protein AidB-like acyl-CoA dehydrogenase
VLRDDVYVQDAVGRAETLLTSARAHVFDVVGDLWANLLDGRQPTGRQLALFTTLYPHSVGVCADVVQLVYKAAGGAAVYQKGPLDRCLRDVLTANQHVVATMRTMRWRAACCLASSRCGSSSNAHHAFPPGF